MSTFGRHFRVTTYGESHCASVGCIVDGVPPGMLLEEKDIQPQMTRRRPGQSAISTPRDEKDKVHIQSGTEFGVTLGTPIGMLVLNENQRPKDYGNSTMDKFPRPSHADWTYLEKYGVKASSGGGRSSARETIGRVAAGAIAEKFLREAYGVEIVAFTSSVGSEHLYPPERAKAADLHSMIQEAGGSAEEAFKQYLQQQEAAPVNKSDSLNPKFLELIDTITRDKVDSFLPVRCPDTDATDRMEKLIGQFRDNHDSIGGTVTCVIRNCPSGLGEPCFDKLEAALGHAMLSIPATKSFDIGSGKGGCEMAGSIHNDAFVVASSDQNQNPSETRPAGERRPRLTTKTNNSGGIQGGITNGAPIYFTVGFKPPATIGQAQQTATYDESSGVLEAKGRHDPCVIPRAVPIVEAMAALVVMDAVAAQASRQTLRGCLPPLKATVPVAETQGDLSKGGQR
ncbi:hypothetical protein MBLNU230_g1514t1 [Neophaeotheca triangularis]